MRDFLDRVVGRAMGQPPAVVPVVASRYGAPEHELAPPAAGAGGDAARGTQDDTEAATESGPGRRRSLGSASAGRGAAGGLDAIDTVDALNAVNAIEDRSARVTLGGVPSSVSQGSRTLAELAAASDLQATATSTRASERHGPPLRLPLPGEPGWAPATATAGPDPTFAADLDSDGPADSSARGSGSGAPPSSALGGDRPAPGAPAASRGADAGSASPGGARGASVGTTEEAFWNFLYGTSDPNGDAGAALPSLGEPHGSLDGGRRGSRTLPEASLLASGPGDGARRGLEPGPTSGQGDGAAAPEINVVIERIDVRSPAPAPVARAAAPARRGPKVTLTEYLRQYGRGGQGR